MRIPPGRPRQSNDGLTDVHQPITTERNHILTVDAARGVMALIVMAYHILEREAVVEVERAAYYAVYSFFVISGFSLHIAYRDKLATAAGIQSYLIKRFFRIAPLFYVALLLRLLLVPLPSNPLSSILVNLSLAFGFADAGALSLINGGWSIGIEMVFYVIFPVMMLVCANDIRRLAAVAFGGILLMVCFDNFILQGAQTMTSTIWSQYTQPAAFFGYFAAGALFAEVLTRFPWIKGQTVAIPIAAICLIPFLLIRVDAPVHLLVGAKGFILMMSSLIFVGAVAFVSEPRGKLREISVWLGVLSYPVYLLHPQAHQLLLRIGFGNQATRSIAVVVLTIALSLIVSKYLEMPAREYGRQLAAKWSAKLS